MSQFPAAPTGGAPNPFAASPQGFPPPQKSKVWLWILLARLAAASCCAAAVRGSAILALA